MCFVYDIRRMDYHRKRRSKSERDKQKRSDVSTKVLVLLSCVLYLLANLVAVHLVFGLLVDNSVFTCSCIMYIILCLVSDIYTA